MSNDTDVKLTKLLEGSLEVEPPMHYPVYFNIADLIICIISTNVNILILLTISKYKERKAVYTYLKHFLICDIIYIIINTLEYQMRSSKLNELSDQINCVTLSLANTTRSINILFLLVLVYQWFFEKTKLTLFETYPRFISLCVWIGLMLQTATLLTTCSMDLRLNYGGNSLQLVLIVFDVFLCVFMLVRKCANPFSKTFGTLSIAIANALPLFWTIPLVTGFIVVNLHLKSDFASVVAQAIDMSVFLYPLITFCMFYRMDSKFKVGLKLLFRRDVSREERLNFYDDATNIKMGPVE